MGKQDAIFCFLDGLQGLTKMELKRPRVQDLAYAIVDAKSLIKFKKESTKRIGEKTHNDGDNDKERGDSPKKD